MLSALPGLEACVAGATGAAVAAAIGADAGADKTAADKIAADPADLSLSRRAEVRLPGLAEGLIPNSVLLVCNEHSV